ncbi:methyltransferase domain-containing protein [Candidatus Nomurabacteria bacterium]|nr:methyltransferase domain-containing protein [Candidatus Nomurabacteria bacterium]
MKKERELNREYKKSILKNKNFCPFRYEKQMDYLFSFLKKDFIKKDLKILESGCGQGRLLFYLNEFNNNQEYWGIDYLAENIKYAKNLFKDDQNIKLYKYNFFDLSKKYKKFFDISISYKTLSWLPDYKDAVLELIKSTKEKIYITSLFSNNNFSSFTKIYDHNNKTYTYLNTYSVADFKRFCLNNGAKKVKFVDMRLDIDLPENKSKSVLQTHTKRTKGGENLEITANTILNWKLVIIEI